MMSLADELDRLSRLHQDGQLSHEEFSRAKARVLHGASPAGNLSQAVNALQRSRRERWLGGVCGGLSKVSGLAPWVWRLVFVLLLPMAASGVLIYLLMWIFLPQEPVAPALGLESARMG